ncbi:uncharacterized protein LOC141629103 [Silene latifolia]|uniref:uncharacterized protein LOC141629103 n=1 Tax=Silene latifolia TaxID=37657 RepID=UPI003D782B06
MVCGDFNNLLNLNERIGGAPVSWNDVMPMRHMVGTCNLAEVKSVEAYFTWNNKHESGSNIYNKRDRVFVNREWLTSYPKCYANFLPEGLFDYCPCLVNFKNNEPQKRSPFKYFNMWSLVEEFEDTVRQSLVKNVRGSPMYRVVTKLKSLKKGLRDLNNKNFSDIENITRVTEISLREFQVMLIKDPLNKEWCEAEAASAKELTLLKKARDQYLLQKSKEKWMEDGDDNTTYYHARINHRRLRNKVYQVKDKNGIVRRGNCITEAHKIFLAAPVTDEEVRLAMFSIPGTKAPGPDEYSSQFSKDAWVIMGKDVIAVVKNAYQFRKLLKLIACCNTEYKCVAKVICTRLSSILPDIISHSKSAFVKGRNIVGNILLTQDLIKMYKRKSCSPIILMKVDLQKRMTVLSDDLIMFCRGDKQSVMLLLRAFQTFSQASGLNMNHSKSNMYSNGVEESTMIMLERISGMRRGKIPFKYLGVNITPKRLGVEDCHCLIERISARIQGLGARKLSYAGRVVLIKSILSTLHNYWACIFILPKTIINRIEAMYRKFLWHGNDSKGSSALVAWDQEWFDYKPGVGASWAWKKICWVKDIIKPLLLTQRTDTYVIKQGYQWLVEEGTDKEWHPWISNSLIIPRHKFTIWLTAHKRLLTMDRLMRMGIVQSNICYFCGAAAESMDHIFFQCTFSNRCLVLVQDWLMIQLPKQGFIKWWVTYITQSLVKKQVVAVALASLCYHIWTSRNKCRIEGLVPHPRVLVLKYKAEIIMRFRGINIKSKIGRIHDWIDMICKGLIFVSISANSI